MLPRVAVDAAQAAAVMVRAHGPDPKGRKMRKHAFFHTESGDTTLSASGFLSLKTAALEVGEKVALPCRNQFRCATVPMSSLVVVTCGSIVEPFLSQQPNGTAPVEARVFPKLIPGAEVDVLVEVLDSRPTDMDYHHQCWIPAHLECVVDIPAAGTALQPLLDIHGRNLDGGWEVGWTLARSEGNCQEDERSRRSPTVEEAAFTSDDMNGFSLGSLSMAATRVALLSLSWEGMEAAAIFQGGVWQQACEDYRPSEVSFGLAVASCLERGDCILAVGSPFGTLSPLHFHNSLSAGVVSNRWPPTSKPAALLMVDVRCLPGMEGGPVLDKHGALVGMLTRPLRQRNSGTEVQLVMTAAVLAPALLHAGVALGVPCTRHTRRCDHNATTPAWFNCTRKTLETDSCRGVMGRSSPNLEFSSLAAPAIARALKSVVLVTSGDGAWASGVIISKTGLILTNAHVLEPWRFGKMRSDHSLSSSCSGGSAVKVEGGVNYYRCCYGSDEFRQQRCVLCSVDEKLTTEKYHHCRPFSVFNSSIFGVEGSTLAKATRKPAEMRWRGYQRIRVRLEYQHVRSWHNAEAVYVSQGPLDIALLQLMSPPPDICPIVQEESCPPTGSTAIVIGHGLFGPWAELSPSASVGVVARVIKAGRQVIKSGRCAENEESYATYPAMLQTTAAVHPGGSGGAVVNCLGRLIGLVTSNARHSGGSVIPFLNFSVPYGALAPIFDFASAVSADLTSLSLLDEPDRILSAVWALVPSSPPRPPIQPLPTPFPFDAYQIPPSLPSLPQSKEMKGRPNGSRCAGFISGREGEISLGHQAESDNGQQISHSCELQPICTTLYSPQIGSRL